MTPSPAVDFYNHRRSGQSVVMASPTGSPIDGVVLDHVAHAVPRWQDVWNRYAVDLGAVWNSGGPGPGFAPAQLRFANSARVEVLMPNDVEVNDFLARFLAANGPGPHHLTFKVPDLAGALDQVRAAGFDPVGIDLSHPEWLEAFLHPKQATGVVVQLAEAPVPWSSPPPPDYPVGYRRRSDGSGPVPPGALRWVSHAVADLDSAVSLFAGLLGGEAVGEGSLDGVRWIELSWSGPLGLRLLAPVDDRPSTPLGTWLAGRPGRVHHLDFSAAEPEGIAGAVPTEDHLAMAGSDTDLVAWEVPPEDNGGLRLVVRPQG